jgi:hypothetical protein
LPEPLPKPPPNDVIVEKTESFPVVPLLPAEAAPEPPAPMVTVYVAPLETFNPVAVLNPPAPPPGPLYPFLAPPPPPPATTKYSTGMPPTKEPLDVNVWIVLPPLDVTVPPANFCVPA